MGNGGSLINIGELSKPVTVLVEKISDAVGWVFRPMQIRRVARAEADADLTRAVAKIEITEVQRRAVQRFVVEETRKQVNMESIIQGAIPRIREDAPTENIEIDWISHFFDKCRLISDVEMQKLWSAVLAGEANSPGQYSKRTVSLLSSLDKQDASLFQNLCSFGWVIEGEIQPLIYDHNADTYNNYGITFESLQHLDSIGLISFQAIGSYYNDGFPKRLIVHYYCAPVEIEFPNPKNNRLQVGCVLLTKSGKQLAPICAFFSNGAFLEYVKDRWKKQGLVVDGPSAEPQIDAPEPD